MRQVKFESEKDTDTLYIKPDVYDDYDLDDELRDGLLLAQDQEGNVYILERDQVAASDDDNNPGLTWHRLGACATYDCGEAFLDKVVAMRWALNQGWRIWYAGVETQEWIGKQLRALALQIKEVTAV
jgi:hypothetical protein